MYGIIVQVQVSLTILKLTLRSDTRSAVCMMYHKLEFVLISSVTQPWRNFSPNLKTTTSKLFCTDFQLINHADNVVLYLQWGKGYALWGGYA